MHMHRFHAHEVVLILDDFIYVRLIPIEMHIPNYMKFTHVAGTVYASNFFTG